MLDPRISAVADAFDELHALVSAEPALVHVVPATALLSSLARDVRAGLPVQVIVPKDPTRRIPSKVLAERILAVVEKAPGPLGNEPAETVKVMATLHHNLARAVVYSILEDYPELIPH